MKFFQKALDISEKMYFISRLQVVLNKKLIDVWKIEAYLINFNEVKTDYFLLK